MANFTSNSTSYIDHNDLNWDLLNPFITNTNDSTLIQNSIMDYQSLLGFSGDHQLLTQLSPSSSSLAQEKLHGTSTSNNPINISGLENTDITRGRRNIELGRIARNKRKADELPGFCSLNSSSPVSSSDVHKTGKAKRTKSSDKVTGEKPKEVVHVRAKRGHATDSHSIAERVRRGKINERLKHLQDIVPGCHKTMGMAPMLDEIINYVQSLQNQVEFLSMKLTAASHFHDFNADMEPQQKPQCGSMQTMNACNTNIQIEAQDMESIITQSGYDEGVVANVFQQTWPF